MFADMIADMIVVFSFFQRRNMVHSFNHMGIMIPHTEKLVKEDYSYNRRLIFSSTHC